MLFYKNVTLVFVSYNHLYLDSRKNEYVIMILFLKLKKPSKRFISIVVLKLKNLPNNVDLVSFR